MKSSGIQRVRSLSSQFSKNCAPDSTSLMRDNSALRGIYNEVPTSKLCSSWNQDRIHRERYSFHRVFYQSTLDHCPSVLGIFLLCFLFNPFNAFALLSYRIPSDWSDSYENNVLKCSLETMSSIQSFLLHRILNISYG